MKYFFFGMALSVPLAMALTWAGQIAQNPKAEPLPAPWLVNELSIHG